MEKKPQSLIKWSITEEFNFIDRMILMKCAGKTYRTGARKSEVSAVEFLRRYLEGLRLRSISFNGHGPLSNADFNTIYFYVKDRYFGSPGVKVEK